MSVVELFFTGSRLGIVAAGFLYGLVICSVTVWCGLWIIVEAVWRVAGRLARRRGK